MTRNGPAEIRADAARIVAEVIDRGRSLDELLAESKRRRLGARAQAVALLRHVALAFPAVRDPQGVDAMRSPDQLHPRLRALLEIGLQQLIAGETPPHAAVSETVSAARVLGFEKAAGFVNAVLRRFQREQAGRAARGRPRSRACVPRIRAGSSRRCARNAAAMHLTRCSRPTTRIRRYGCGSTACARTRPASVAALEAAGFKAEPHPWAPDAILRLAADRRPQPCPASSRAACRCRTRPRNWPSNCSTRNQASGSSTPARRPAARPAMCSSARRGWSS